MAANPRVVSIDPAQASVTVGTQLMQGFGEDIVVAGRINDQWTDQSGADGEVVRINSNDQRGDITITLMATSKSNLYLSGLIAADRASGAGVVPIAIRWPQAGITISADKAWCVRDPEIKINKGVNMHVYKFRCGVLTQLPIGVQAA